MQLSWFSEDETGWNRVYKFTTEDIEPNTVWLRTTNMDAHDSCEHT